MGNDTYLTKADIQCGTRWNATLESVDCPCDRLGSAVVIPKFPYASDDLIIVDEVLEVFVCTDGECEANEFSNGILGTFRTIGVADVV